MGRTPEEALEQLRLVAELRLTVRRLLLGAFGDPGHAFPMIALGRALVARGNDVTLQTWQRWEEHVDRGRHGFAPAPEDQVFPTPERPLNPYDAALPPRA